METLTNLYESGFEIKGWCTAVVTIVRGDQYLVENAKKEDKIVSRDQLRPWTPKVPIRHEDFAI